MWCCLNRSFISIVADRHDKKRLLVRARIAGHIEAVFPDAEVFTDVEADYFYRAYISRAEVGRVLAAEVRRIDYDNFKSSVANQALHDAYLGFWRIMHTLQDAIYTKKVTI